MELFKGQSLLEFTERFKTDLDCEEYLASIKWKKGYCCRKCGHTKYQVCKDFSRTCNICSDTESPTAGTLLHKLKFGLLKAFYICFEMSTTTKSLSAPQVALPLSQAYSLCPIHNSQFSPRPTSPNCLTRPTIQNSEFKIHNSLSHPPHSTTAPTPPF